MDEASVKAKVLGLIRRGASPSGLPIVTAEFTLGRSGTRADLAMFGRRLVGVEIKTAQDSLRRLPAQLDAYADHFHRVMVVVANCHLRHLQIGDLRGASLWAYEGRGPLREIHQGGINAVDEAVLARVMTKAEERRGDFSAAVQARYGQTSRRFWEAVAGRPIRSEDLTQLSRFAERRAEAKRFAEERKVWWSDWLAAQQAYA